MLRDLNPLVKKMWFMMTKVTVIFALRGVRLKMLIVKDYERNKQLVVVQLRLLHIVR